MEKMNFSQQLANQMDYYAFEDLLLRTEEQDWCNKKADRNVQLILHRASGAILYDTASRFKISPGRVREIERRIINRMRKKREGGEPHGGIHRIYNSD